jgi:hypothetical protein
MSADIHIPIFSVGGWLSVEYHYRPKNSYTVDQILKAIAGPLVTRAGVEAALGKLLTRYDLVTQVGKNKWRYKPCACRLCMGA